MLCRNSCTSTPATNARCERCPECAAACGAEAPHALLWGHACATPQGVRPEYSAAAAARHQHVQESMTIEAAELATASFGDVMLQVRCAGAQPVCCSLCCAAASSMLPAPVGMPCARGRALLHIADVTTLSKPAFRPRCLPFKCIPCRPSAPCTRRRRKFSWAECWTAAWRRSSEPAGVCAAA